MVRHGFAWVPGLGSLPLGETWNALCPYGTGGGGAGLVVVPGVGASGVIGAVDADDREAHECYDDDATNEDEQEAPHIHPRRP